MSSYEPRIVLQLVALCDKHQSLQNDMRVTNWSSRPQSAALMAICHHFFLKKLWCWGTHGHNSTYNAFWIIPCTDFVQLIFPNTFSGWQSVLGCHKATVAAKLCPTLVPNPWPDWGVQSFGMQTRWSVAWQTKCLEVLNWKKALIAIDSP